MQIRDESHDWNALQNKDLQIKKIRSDLAHHRCTAGYSLNQYDLLCYYGKIVVPNVQIENIITTYHSSGHFSTQKVREAILGAGYWFHNMYQCIRKSLNKCEKCSAKSGHGYTTTKTCLPKSPDIEPFEFVAIDIVGPLSIQRSGYRYVVTMIDHSTRWLEAAPVTDIRAETIAKVFSDQWLMRYGPPAVLHSDRGTQFLSTIMAELFRKFEIKKTQTTAYNPQGNSVLERVHRTLKDRLATSNASWLDSLRQAVFDINRTQSSATGNSPMNLVFGRHGCVPQDWPCRQRFKATVNYTGPAVGEFVAIKTVNSTPLSPKFQGRFKVLRRPTPHVAVLDNNDTYEYWWLMPFAETA